VGYNCVVCVKQVPDTKRITGQAMKEDGTVNRAALPAVFNPEDLNALEAALRSGHLGGASLDVQENEPMKPSDPLWVAPNLQLTPHIAGQLSPDAVVAQFMDEVERLKRGEPLLRQVSAAAGY
jgi:hypothetical protein